jgi:hypothetical protein
MRVVATLADNRIVQVEKNPPNGEGVARNGMYMMPVAEGVKVLVDSTSVVLPTGSPNSVVARNFAGLLARFPQFENILFNPLIEAADVDDLDPAGVLNQGTPISETYGSRFQIGRGTGGPLAAGNAANSVAVLSSNDTAGVGNERPGVLISNTIDVGPLTGNAGATEFAVYYYIYEFETSIDVRSDFGLYAGQNSAAVRRVLEIDQEPDDFEVWLSINDGANFVQVQRLVPVSFCSAGTLARIALKNLNPLRKRYVAHYALLF